MTRLTAAQLAGAHLWGEARFAGCPIRRAAWSSGWIYWVGGAWVKSSPNHVVKTFGLVANASIGPNGGSIPGSPVEISEDDLRAADWTSDAYPGQIIPPLPTPPVITQVVVTGGNLVISGTGSPNSTITLAINGVNHSVLVNSSGNWSYSQPSSSGASYNIDLSYSSQTDVKIGITSSVVAGGILTIVGTATPNSTITLTINGVDHSVLVNSSGNWSYSQPTDGSLNYNVEAIDAEGNSAVVLVIAAPVIPPQPRIPSPQLGADPNPPRGGSSGGSSGGGGGANNPPGGGDGSGGTAGGGGGGGGNEVPKRPPLEPTQYPTLSIYAESADSCLTSDTSCYAVMHLEITVSLSTTVDTVIGGRASGGVIVSVHGLGSCMLLPGQNQVFGKAVSVVSGSGGRYTFTADCKYGSVTSAPVIVPAECPCDCPDSSVTDSDCYGPNTFGVDPATAYPSCACSTYSNTCYGGCLPKSDCPCQGGFHSPNSPDCPYGTSSTPIPIEFAGCRGVTCYECAEPPLDPCLSGGECPSGWFDQNNCYNTGQYPVDYMACGTTACTTNCYFPWWPNPCDYWTPCQDGGVNPDICPYGVDPESVYGDSCGYTCYTRCADCANVDRGCDGVCNSGIVADANGTCCNNEQTWYCDGVCNSFNFEYGCGCGRGFRIYDDATGQYNCPDTPYWGESW